jgi:hypothetical protein
MKPQENINRREFMGKAGKVAATAATFSIVPAHVLAGSGKIAPSDKLTVANIGCGTQGLREMGEMLRNPRIQVVAVCDVNKYSTDYLDWSAQGITRNIRRVLQDDSWAQDIKGIPGGRDYTKKYIDQYYGSKSCKPYEDFRELLAKQKDLDVVKIMTPDHTHAAIAVAAMQRKVHVVTHKPIANRLAEGRFTIETARKEGVLTNLLAWKPIPEHKLILEWINDGVIGTLQEIHNWSFRPVWPKWHAVPADTPPVPKGFNWELWLGPEKDRPYHPHYTHNVFRGWYDFGGGSIADMGHYSLFTLFDNLGIDRGPTSIKSYGTTNRTVVDQVCRGVKNDVAFPYSSMVRFKFPSQKALPAFDLYWYDGGMKPFAPEELEADGRDIPAEGMMFVGDEGKILASFLGENPEIIPSWKMNAYQGRKAVEKKETKEGEQKTRTDLWAESILNGDEAGGSFLKAGTITDTINLAAVALRTGKRLAWDEANMRITNDEEANQYLSRDYRKGWELG